MNDILESNTNSTSLQLNNYCFKFFEEYDFSRSFVIAAFSSELSWILGVFELRSRLKLICEQN